MIFKVVRSRIFLCSRRIGVAEKVDTPLWNEIIFSTERRSRQGASTYQSIILVIEAQI